MAADKLAFVDNVTGLVKDYNPVQSSAGAGDANKVPALGTDGKLDTTMMPTGIGADTRIVPTSENLSAGDLVNLYSATGVLTARKADASGGVAKKCDGYVIAATTSPANATIYFDGTISGMSGLTLGTNYFLSGSLAGGVTSTPPTTATHILQSVGKALSATELTFEAGEPIIRA